jgi:hypothetical protein
MRPETLAETLREIVESADAMQKARAALPEGYELWSASRARDYLRGYDDAKAEAAHTEMLLREAQDEIANAKARVRELEAQIAAQPAQERDG